MLTDTPWLSAVLIYDIGSEMANLWLMCRSIPPFMSRRTL